MIKDYKSLYRYASWLCLFGLFAFGAFTRIYGAGAWPVAGDEIFTYERALKNIYPYMVPGIYYLVSISFDMFGTSEFALRLPSVFFGALSFPLFYFVTKRVFNNFSAIAGSIFLIFSVYHLDHSQFARYYSPVFFWGIAATYSFYRFYEDNSWPYMVLAIISSMFGMLFHPTFVFLIFANFAVAVFVFTVRPKKCSSEQIKASKKMVIAGAAAAVIIIPVCVKILSMWNGTSADAGWGYTPFYFSLQLIKYFNVVICLVTLCSTIWLLSIGGFRGIFFSALIVIPVLTAICLSKFVDVRPDYVMSVYPLFFMLSGKFCSILRDEAESGKYVSVFLVIIIAGSMMPDFVSHYTGRRSLEIREAVNYIHRNYSEGDTILSLDGSFSFYMNSLHKVEPYIGEIYLPGLERKLRKYRDEPGRVWVVLTEPRTGMNQGLKSWLMKNTKTVWEKFEKRFDYTFRVIRIYEIDKSKAVFSISP